MISVCLASCDGMPWMVEQVGSILSQLGDDDELVVSDASSTDGTLEYLHSVADPRLRLFAGFPRGSVVDNFRHALEVSRGGTVFLSDQDDVWLPGKVQACLQALEDSDAALVLHDARLVDASGRILSESFLEARGMREGFWHQLWKPGYLGCALAFRRRLLELALPFPEGLPMHDWWLGLLAERRGGVRVLRQPLLLHRRHGGNANFSPGSSPYSPLRRFLFRWKMLKEVGRRLSSTRVA